MVSSKAETELLDMTYFAEYNQEAGFKIAVDGLHNTPNGIPYGTVFSIRPGPDEKSENYFLCEISNLNTIVRFSYLKQ